MPKMSIKIISDSTCDLSKDLIKEFDIEIVPLHINMNGSMYLDGVDISTDDIFRHVDNGGDLCTTVAANVSEWQEVFSRFSPQYDQIVTITISADFSGTFQSAKIAAEEFSNVFVVDSRNLSTGVGHSVLRAAELARAGKTAEEITADLEDFVDRVDASFILDRLDYMRKGGRCSAVAALGANLLKLKPSIHVVGGKMQVGKKYRGAFEKCMVEYIKDKLADADGIEDHRIFITYSSLSPELEALAIRTVRECKKFENVNITRAGCTIACHCGQNCIGVLFVRKDKI